MMELEWGGMWVFEIGVEGVVFEKRGIGFKWVLSMKMVVMW